MEDVAEGKLDKPGLASILEKLDRKMDR